MAEDESKQVTEVEGVVQEALPNTMFRVEIPGDPEPRVVLTVLAGKLRKHYIRIMPGDRVKVEFTPYDKDLGPIVYRMR